MKAITVRQPWARAIAVGAKTVENRGRDCTYRGPIAIHAGKAPDIEADRDERIVRLFGDDPRCGAAVGAVVAVATLADCHPATALCCKPWGEQWYGAGRYAHHLVLADIRGLYRPVPCAGKLWFPWDLPADVAAQVEQQLAVTS